MKRSRKIFNKMNEILAHSSKRQKTDLIDVNRTENAVLTIFLNNYDIKLVENAFTSSIDTFGGKDISCHFIDRILAECCYNTSYRLFCNKYGGRTMKIRIIDSSYKIQEFIPKVPAVMFHLLPATSQKRIQLTSFSRAACPQCSLKRSHAQFAFKLHYDASKSKPFMVILQCITNHGSQLVSTIKINKKCVKLIEKHNNTEHCKDFYEFYMGNEVSDYYFSYLPAFRSLFVDSEGVFFNEVKFDFTFNARKFWKCK